jgi:predicted phage terminase large subunit-like protein
VEKNHPAFYSGNPTCKVCLKKQVPARSISTALEEKLAKHVAGKVTRATLEKIADEEARADLAEKRKVTAAQKELAARLLSRRRLMPFIRRMNPDYLPGWAHEHICRRLEQFERDITDKKSPRLIICLPPRFGKSEIASRNFPAWFLGLHPEWEVVSASHTASLALSFSRKVRETVRSEVFRSTFDGCHLDPDSQALENWFTTHGGSFTAVGVGGSLTGKGAHCLTIDDPVPNMEAAMSELIRENTFSWYSSVARTRVAPGGGVLIIMTLWHDDDLVGRLTAAMGDGGEEFEIIKYAAINDGYDEYLTAEDRILRVYPGDEVPAGAALMRAAGTAIHPDRYPTEEMLRLKRSLVSTGQARVWSALYQQNPVPDEGAYFEKAMFQYLSTTPSVQGMRVIQAWDFAITEKQSSDWTVGVTLAQTPEDKLIVLDIRRFRSGDSFVIVDTILDYFVKWGAFIVGVEDGQIWKAMSALFTKRCRERKLYPNMHLNKPLTDKQVRASPLRGRMQMGSVLFPRDAPWLEGLQHEMLRFPAGKHDDQIDGLAWAVHTAMAFPPTPEARRAQMKSWRDKLNALGVNSDTLSAMTA